MLRILTKTMLISAAATCFSPAMATNVSSSWWLVLDNDSSHTARFVDLASIVHSTEATQVDALTLSNDGHQKIETVSVDCGRIIGSPVEPELRAFVCGSEEYRENNGLKLGPVSPQEMAHMVFGKQSPDDSFMHRSEV